MNKKPIGYKAIRREVISKLFKIIGLLTSEKWWVASFNYEAQELTYQALGEFEEKDVKTITIEIKLG